MGKLVIHLLTSLLLSSLLSSCDSDLTERGKRYLGRVTHGVMDKLQSQVSDGRESIDVLKFFPVPNYSNTDASDRKQLTDASLTLPPMWNRNESVGWQGKTPVLIQIKRENPVQSDGKIRLHAALGAYADVLLPRQIDVYTEVEGGMVVVGSYREKQGLSLEDERSYWIEVPVRGLTDKFVIAVHANGWFVQLDEIEFVPDTSLSNQSVSSQVIPFNSLEEIRDSATEKLILDMEMRATDRFKNKQAWRKAFPKQSMVSWVADPWAADLDQLLPQHIDSKTTSLNVRGTDDEYEHFAIGVYAMGSGISEINITVDGLPKDSFELLSLERVLASDGRMAFDPLQPISGSTLKLESGWPYLVWVKLDLRKLPLGGSDARLSVQSAAQKFAVSYDIDVSVYAAGSSKGVPIWASVWGYSGDLPMWADAKLAVKNQEEHYVNRWTVHPENIPGRELNGKLEQHKMERLLADLSLYKGKGKVRLYLGWTLENNPLGITAKRHTISSTREKAFKQWLLSLNDMMAKAGYKENAWELYPMDEPTGASLDALLPLATIIKKTLPKVVVYSDPISTTADPSSEAQLQALNDVIDIWQPDLALLQGKGRSFFEKQSKDWGFYQNPPLPPKRANPITYYRALGWWAWKTGATGIGFWSYSDTTNSSMWNDFDGRRPDFSVVYDRSGTLLNSRRWEAFAEGIEDYKIMQGAGVRADVSLNPAALDTPSIRSLRENAFEQLN